MTTLSALICGECGASSMDTPIFMTTIAGHIVTTCGAHQEEPHDER